MNTYVGANNFNVMWCDANPMAVWKEVGSKGDYSFHENKAHIFLLTIIASSQHHAWIKGDAQ